MKVFKYLMALTLVVLLLAAAGCGGGKKPRSFSIRKRQWRS